MLQVRDVSYSTGSRQVLNSVTFSITAGDKVTIVVVNDVEEIMLLKIIMR